MPEITDGWLVERGLDENRAVLLEGGAVVAARLDWPGGLKTGMIADAVLAARQAGSARGTVRIEHREALVDRLPKSASEGASLRVEILRPALRERGRTKLAQARWTDANPRPAPALEDTLTDAPVRLVPRFPEGMWEDVWHEAWSGRVDFASGALTFYDTPAMTLIDIDGDDDPVALAHKAVAPLAAAMRRFDMAGSIGIDFPTLAARADRKTVDAALDDALAGWPHERTAMNGFGFVQIVARLDRVPLTRRIANARVGATARFLLRAAERVDGAGQLLITAHPALKAKFTDARLALLARRTGRTATLAFDPGLAMEGGFAQSVSP
ncbi:MAG: ribonuclease [Parerythrobacter sp.]